ncbi:ovochymase-1 [Genypterus blacodes]|uniref:ovochymase-1 n=1 Tax=Genypterus blacodes TaxID=154954 RepID=UPI003F760B04
MRHIELAGIRVFNPEQEMENRIIGGQEAWAHSWPWQVSLRFASMPACGGAIIAPMWVISAAHCFRRYRKASFWTVMAGKHDLDNVHEQSQQLVGVKSIVIHQHYNAWTKESDVALLRLEEPLVFNQHVRPIDVWLMPLPVLKNCTITGWGSTRENGPRVHRLQEVNVTILPWSMCNKYYSGRLRAAMFCAGKAGGGADACQGDSGGPLACYTGSRYELAGVVSWGVGCGRASKPGVYTKVQQYTSWISHCTSDQSAMSDDSGRTTDEDECGRKEEGSCLLDPHPVSLYMSENDKPVVGNVTESCPGQWPWQVSLQSGGRHYCSGTLIHRRWVLVPQHCYVRATEDTVVLGVHDLKFFSSQTIPVDKVFKLPQDSSFPPKSDLTLLRLSAPARFKRVELVAKSNSVLPPDSNVVPVCIPDEDEDEELNDSWSCVTTGWGATKATANVNLDRLHHTRLSLVNQTACRQQWGRGLIGETHICSHPAASVSCMVTDAHRGSDIRPSGDFGAPLLCRKRGPYFLFGLVTWGSVNCDPEKPAIFSRISAYHSWITEVTEDV